MKLLGADTNSGMIRKFPDWFGMNFNPKLLPGNIFPKPTMNIPTKGLGNMVNVRLYWNIPMEASWHILYKSN